MEVITGQFLNSPIEVDRDGDSGIVLVSVNIHHKFVDELELKLMAPDGTEQDLGFLSSETSSDSSLEESPPSFEESPPSLEESSSSLEESSSSVPEYNVTFERNFNGTDSRGQWTLTITD